MNSQNSGSIGGGIVLIFAIILAIFIGTGVSRSKRADRGRKLVQDTINSIGLQSLNIARKDFNGANLSDMLLDGINAEGVNLKNANLINTNLSGANLSKANLQKSNLVRAKLTGTNLIGANLSGANLRGTNLKGAKLKNVVFDRTRYNRLTQWPEEMKQPIIKGIIKGLIKDP